MILIYAENKTPRLEYIARLIFEDILKVKVSVTSDLQEFQKSGLPKINYSGKKLEGILYLKPHKLLFSKNPELPEVTPVNYRGEKYFFPTSDNSFLPFDPLAASFFLVTRMEEYFENELGKYNCYPAEKSILVKNGLLKKPVVNIWARLLAEKIKEEYPEFEIPEPGFSFISTIDVDNAWAYAHKKFLRSTGAFLKDFFTGRWANNITRVKTWFNPNLDPYNSYDFIKNVFSGNEEKAMFFFLLGNYKKYDKNIFFKNRHFRELIRSLAANYKTGIHPSFNSSREGRENLVSIEKKRLEQITGQDITKSRQHFLRLFFPKTYRVLQKSGIKEDYSMGYSSHTGFRAGICTPFSFYDLGKNKETNLKIFPFQVMDVTLNEYLGLSADEAKNEIALLMEEVKKAGGTFISVWHNETLTDRGRWQGYREVFEFMNRKGFNLANE